VIANTRFHSESYTQSFMNTAEVVKPEVQGDSGFQIVQLLRKSIGQSGKAPHLHTASLPTHKPGAI
jgi:hypothetical protein